ncbi:MAG: hypothetical protein HY287_05860 [Planctomycetes bacterium]|nr:hypothetical protein [Planctomycetota bacterium]MBI3833837.1 hypothetical protein [Planctomycetota bacterium]
MPTADRTTIRIAADQLLSRLRSDLIAEPPNAAHPFRRVEVGIGHVTDLSRPFLCLRLLSATPLGTTDDDKVLEVRAVLRAVVELSTSDGHAALLDAVGAVDDSLDAIRDVGIVDGSEGFDDREWRFEYSETTSGVRVAAAEASFTFVVKVKRGSNRAA